MDYARSKGRMNVEDDRLSMLPDDLIHKILSFISTKRVVQTSALSSRWRFLWTSMPYLNISSNEFDTLPKFSEFLIMLLFGRNTQIEVYSVKLTFHEKFREALLKQILDYAFSHNVQERTVTCLVEKTLSFPIRLFQSPSLKYLRLTGRYVDFMYPYSLSLQSPFWDLPALTTLQLDYVAFNEDSLFTKCANLKTLTLTHYTIWNSHKFTLRHPKLSNLTLNEEKAEAINVDAPQLENLSIRTRQVQYCKHTVSISAPNLVSLFFRGSLLLQFSTDLHYLKKVTLCIFTRAMWSGCQVAALLQQLCNTRILMLNLEFIEPLISYMEGISLQPSPFSNLKGLKIYPVHVPSDDEAYKKIIMSSKVFNYFLDASPSATFSLVSYEEIKKIRQNIRAKANATAARNSMANLQVWLEKEKANIEADITRASPVETHDESGIEDQGKAPMESMLLHFNRKMEQVTKCSSDISARIYQGKKNTCYIISKLRDIEVLLLKDLPTSKRDALKACFSSLCLEADTMVKKILHHMMTPHIDDLSECINELSTVSLFSS